MRVGDVSGVASTRPRYCRYSVVPGGCCAGEVACWRRQGGGLETAALQCLEGVGEGSHDVMAGRRYHQSEAVSVANQGCGIAEGRFRPRAKSVRGGPFFCRPAATARTARGCETAAMRQD